MPALSLLLWLFLSVQTSATPLTDMKLVGEARLRVMFFTLYDSGLYTSDGIYHGIEPTLALRIAYRRNISNKRFIDVTRDQWKDLGHYDEGVSEPWLNELSNLLPDVSKGDVLTLQLDQTRSSNFYYNGQLVGTIDDAEFSRKFLSIWLAPNSTYPRLRAQLIGLSD